MPVQTAAEQSRASIRSRRHERVLLVLLAALVLLGAVGLLGLWLSPVPARASGWAIAGPYCRNFRELQEFHDQRARLTGVRKGQSYLRRALATFPQWERTAAKRASAGEREMQRLNKKNLLRRAAELDREVVRLQSQSRRHESWHGFTIVGPRGSDRTKQAL